MPAEELERHVWIQMGSGSEWVDLDPTLPGGAPGTVMAGAVRPLGPIPDELRHVVTIAVVAETMTGGMLR
jgi:hypothetical protein